MIPIFGCTAVWLKSSYTISIGSSMVVMLISGEASVLERRVERDGLAAAGRAGDEDDAVRALDPVARTVFSSSS